MTWLRDLIIRKWFKGLLDKLPANGKKTIISVGVFVLTLVLAYAGQDTSIGSVTALLLEQLKSLQYYDLQDVSLGAAALFLIHKITKWLDRGWELEEKLEKKDEPPSE